MKRHHRIATLSTAAFGASLLAAGLLAPEAAATTGTLHLWTGINQTGTPFEVTDFDTGCVTLEHDAQSALNWSGDVTSLYDTSGQAITTLGNGASSNLRPAAHFACAGNNSLPLNHNETLLG